MYYDYHMHSNFSGDSQTPMEDMVKKSIDIGLKEICFTDHVDYDIISDVEFETDYDAYFKNINMLKDKYKNKIKRIFFYVIRTFFKNVWLNTHFYTFF